MDNHSSQHISYTWFQHSTFCTCGFTAQLDIVISHKTAYSSILAGDLWQTHVSDTVCYNSTCLQHSSVLFYTWVVCQHHNYIQNTYSIECWSTFAAVSSTPVTYLIAVTAHKPVIVTVCVHDQCNKYSTYLPRALIVLHLFITGFL